MSRNYILKTVLCIPDLSPKVEEIIGEINLRFGASTVHISRPYVGVHYAGNLTVSETARLDNLVGRLGDHALGAALVESSYDGIPRALRIIGPSPEAIALHRRVMDGHLRRDFEQRSRPLGASPPKLSRVATSLVEG